MNLPDKGYRQKKTFKLLVFLIFILCAYLSLKGLDSAYIWDDESETILIAKNFLSSGHFTAWDGRNLFAYRNGTFIDKNLYSINPPLTYLLCALSFKIFGLSTWAARFPFVILGLISLIIFALVLRMDFGAKNQAVNQE